MRKERINGHNFEFYDSIEDLPITQFHKYSKYVLVDCGIGSDISSIDAHIGKIIQFIGVDDKKARQETLNLRRSLFMAANEQDTRFHGYLCLVNKVDGKKWTDFSDSGIDELYLMVQDGKMIEMAEVFGELKNTIDDQLSSYFPSVFNNVVGRNCEVLMRKRALLQLATIIDDVDNEKEIEKVTRQIMAYNKPQNFEEGEDAEMNFDKQFESMCLAMSKEFGGQVKGYSVMEFYSAYETLEKQNEELRKIKSRR